MSHFTEQPPPSPHTTHGKGPSSHHRPQPRNRYSIDSIASPPPNSTARASRMQADRNGAMPMPVGNGHAQQRHFGGGNGGIMGGNMRGPASPPKNKNTQHVPCKFFLQGQCQAGSMCPFSHDVESTTRPTPCKYFAKGGCKFGRKCALLHITPEGQIVNRPYPQHQQPYMPQAQTSFAQPPPPGLLSMQAQGLEQRPNGEQYDNYAYSSRQQDANPQIDMTYTSASPKFGSPNLNDHRLAASPPYNGLSVLDAPLPNSFDSNGISWAARNGPFAASVPSKFDSPPSSLPRQTPQANSTLRDLHSSAFGDRNLDNLLAMSTSPPTSNPADETPISFEKRPLHSARFRQISQTQPRQLLSASLGARYISNPLSSAPTSNPFTYPYASDDNEDDNTSDYDPADTDREEDLLPSSLHDLIPEGPRSRRESRPNANPSSPVPSSFLNPARRTFSNSTSTPSAQQDSKLPSPGLTSSSPSRYSGVFARTQAGSALNGLGHVGSPLRDSTFPTDWAGGLSSPLGTPLSAGEGGFIEGLGSPPLGRDGKGGMSMLTQGLRATKLSNGTTNSAAATGAAGSGLASGGSASGGGASRKPIDRIPSTASVSRPRIDEEKDGEIFDMDFEGGASSGEGKEAKSGDRKASRKADGDGRSFGPIGGGRGGAAK
ncbi:unnamed protein product [Zymoseptoria tritici ST99CH_3D7]|uniref:C3H1-type domain-containing protein n=1 Tax=Zymoseptoria tritici (strain ST99CH_3D7) TaxID=1276538 RepID=A0A1X7RW06_ZYMT9|nr:unnamed protein product [Zymoseptoria tritici ST99CH_3D7]